MTGTIVSRQARITPALQRRSEPQHWVIRRNCQTGECSLELLQWGLIPNWCKDPEGYRNGAALCRWTGWHCVPAPRRPRKGAIGAHSSLTIALCL